MRDAVLMAFMVDSPFACSETDSMAFEVDASMTDVEAVTMAFGADALMIRAGADWSELRVEDPMTYSRANLVAFLVDARL